MAVQPSNYKFKKGETFVHPLQDQLEEHYTSLLKLAYTYVKNSEMAEDIVQDVCEKALQKQHDFRADASYKTYLIRMTINRSYDYLRSWKYKQLSLTHTVVQLLHMETPEQKALQHDKEAKLGLEILKLKPKYREVIVLYYYEDFSVNDIATMLQTSENTVKTRLKRARDQLKNSLTLKGEVFDA